MFEMANEEFVGMRNLSTSVHINMVQGIDGYLWKCSTCNFTASLHSGSFFTKSKLSLPVLILLIYYWAKQSPQKEVRNELACTHTTVDWYNSCRDVRNTFTWKQRPDWQFDPEWKWWHWTENRGIKILSQKIPSWCMERGTLGIYLVGLNTVWIGVSWWRLSSRMQILCYRWLKSGFHLRPRLCPMDGLHIITSTKLVVAFICIMWLFIRIILLIPLIVPYMHEISKLCGVEQSVYFGKKYGTSRAIFDSNLIEFMWRSSFGKDDAFSTIVSNIATQYPV